MCPYLSLSGIVATQVFMYRRSYPHDRSRHKAMVRVPVAFEYSSLSSMIFAGMRSLVGKHALGQLSPLSVGVQAVGSVPLWIYLRIGIRLRYARTQ